MKEDFKEDTGMELFITLRLPREIRIGSMPDRSPYFPG